MRSSLILLFFSAILAAASEQPDLAVTVLGGKAGDSPQGAWTDDGGFALRLIGRDAYGGLDDGAFAAIETAAPSFTFTARIRAMPAFTDKQAPKVGISLRESLSPSARAIHLRYDGYRGNKCLQWFQRHLEAAKAAEGSQRCHYDETVPAASGPNGMWLRLRRRWPRVELAWSADGDTWHDATPGYHLAQDATGPVHVGLHAVAGGLKDGQVVFDQVSFTVDERRLLDPASLVRYVPPTTGYRMFLTTTSAGETVSPFIILPPGRTLSQCRALLWSAGSKEVTLADGSMLPWEKGEGRLRRPTGFDAWQGVVELPPVRAFYDMLDEHRIARLGGAFNTSHLEAALAALRETHGLTELDELPLVVTGASFAGGIAASAALEFPDRVAASAPLLIGMAGADATGDPLQVPVMHIYGSNDGPHLDHANQVTEALRNRGARWANATMWRFEHRQGYADALLYPFFLDVLDLRLPADWKPGNGRPELAVLAEDSGWLGEWDGMRGRYATIMPFADHQGGGKGKLVWLPTARTAHLWRAFVVDRPRILIHFPAFDGTSTFGGIQPKGDFNDVLAAGEAFPVVASGPVVDGMTVTWFVDGEVVEAEPLVGPEQPWLVRLPAQDPGLHTITAVLEIDGQREGSHPETLHFARRR